jgi:hypothetical protein
MTVWAIPDESLVGRALTEQPSVNACFSSSGPGLHNDKHGCAGVESEHNPGRRRVATHEQLPGMPWSLPESEQKMEQLPEVLNEVL